MWTWYAPPGDTIAGDGQGEEKEREGGEKKMTTTGKISHDKVNLAGPIGNEERENGGNETEGPVHVLLLHSHRFSPQLPERTLYPGRPELSSLLGPSQT